MALPLGELSPKVTERALHPRFPSPSSLRSATSPIGRGKGVLFHSVGRAFNQQFDKPIFPIRKIGKYFFKTY